MEKGNNMTNAEFLMMSMKESLGDLIREVDSEKIEDKNDNLEEMYRMLKELQMENRMEETEK